MGEIDLDLVECLDETFGLTKMRERIEELEKKVEELERTTIKKDDTILLNGSHAI